VGRESFPGVSGSYLGRASSVVNSLPVISLGSIPPHLLLSNHFGKIMAVLSPGRTGYRDLQRLPGRFHQCLEGPRFGLPQDPFDLREGLLYGVSMRRHILSRANVVASGSSVEPTPLSATFPSALRVGQLRVARCSIGSVQGGAAI
jgi:hypothetical protein